MGYAFRAMFVSQYVIVAFVYHRALAILAFVYQEMIESFSAANDPISICLCFPTRK
jgi:hypothetical protein